MRFSDSTLYQARREGDDSGLIFFGGEECFAVLLVLLAFQFPLFLHLLPFFHHPLIHLAAEDVDDVPELFFVNPVGVAVHTVGETLRIVALVAPKGRSLPFKLSTPFLP